MAGFSQIGPGGFSINPPLMSRPFQSPQTLPLGIDRQRTQQSPFFNPNEHRGFNTGGDDSNQHLANVYLGKSGLGETGQDNSQLKGYPGYGFTPEDYDNITRYLNNPLNSQNVGNYMGIANRLSSMTNTNPQFSQWGADTRRKWSTDFPLGLASGFNLVPPPVLQSWNIPIGTAPNIRY